VPVFAIPDHSTVIARTLEAAASSPYPPSFDNNPLVFGWALFARLLVLLLSVSTLIKLRDRNIKERIPANHPVYYHRMVNASFLWAAVLASGGDVMTYLFWNEVSVGMTATVLLIAKLLDALTMIPFIMALFVPVWMKWLCQIGILKTAPSMTLNGLVNDARATWTSAGLPIRLTLYSAAAAALTTVAKYWLWLEHGRL
jgi:hypothetical protein